MATQADIDALVVRVTALGDAVAKGVADLTVEIQNLQTQGIDTTGLESAVSTLTTNVQGLTDLDAANQPPTP